MPAARSVAGWTAPPAANSWHASNRIMRHRHHSPLRQLPCTRSDRLDGGGDRRRQSITEAEPAAEYGEVWNVNSTAEWSPVRSEMSSVVVQKQVGTPWCSCR